MVDKSIKDVIKAAEELSRACGRVIRNEGLSDLERAIANLDAKQLEYMRKVDIMNKRNCGSCSLPCGEDWCVTKE